MVPLPEKPPQSLFDYNRELLHGGELGTIAETAYVAAVEHDPRLDTMKVVADGGRRASFARAVPSWASMETPLHRVFLPAHNANVRPALVRLIEDTARIPGAMEHYAAKMGIQPDAITPEGMYAFALLHEFGHVSDYIDHSRRQREFAERDRAEKRALPIPDVAVSVLMSPGTTPNFQITKHWPEIAAEQGVKTLEELYARQFKAYRSMATEARADDFAAAVLAAHPELALPLAA